MPSDLDRKLDLLGEKLDAVLAALHAAGNQRAHYTVEEFSALLGRRPYTVREWCRLCRIHAGKAASGRGGLGREEWRIAHEELERFRREGLLPQ